jgi:amidase
MRLEPSRRSFIAGLGTAAAAGALKPAGVKAREDPSGPAYRTAGELVKALADRQISARELLDAAISRIEALDPKINTVVVRDFPTTWGDPKFRDWRPEADALVVQRLKAAGAVILGKTSANPRAAAERPIAP